MAIWKDEDELFALMKEKLYTPVVGDILDMMGYSHQFLPASIHPLRDDMKLAGKACTVLECDVFEAQKKPFGLLTEALDQLQKNEVYVATGAHNSALWGELLTATAKTRGAVGAVLDGYTRDTPQVLAQNFPVFAADRWAQDSSIRTNVIDFGGDYPRRGPGVRRHGRGADYPEGSGGGMYREVPGKGSRGEEGPQGH